jgi:hypothetical protein
MSKVTKCKQVPLSDEPRSAVLRASARSSCHANPTISPDATDASLHFHSILTHGSVPPPASCRSDHLACICTLWSTVSIMDHRHGQAGMMADWITISASLFPRDARSRRHRSERTMQCPPEGRCHRRLVTGGAVSSRLRPPATPSDLPGKV